MNKSLFEFSEYKAFLRAISGVKQRKGVRLAISKALRCQPAYISQVLNGGGNFSLEQGEGICQFLGFGKQESHYFLLLLQKERAGTKNLRVYFEEQIEEVQKRRLVLTERLGKEHELTEAQRAEYYSSWIYAAVHIGLSIPGLQEKKLLAEFFQLPQMKVAAVVDFLLHSGLVVERAGGGYDFGPSKIRLGNDSPQIVRHHSNWRVRAMESLEREGLSDMHYSGVVSISRADAVRIKESLLEQVKKCQAVVADSPEEELYGIGLDFFNLRVQVK